MKKIATIISALILIIGFAGVASGIPYKWSEKIDWDGDVLLNKHNKLLKYTHNLGKDGFNSDTDEVKYYGLVVRLYDDKDRRREKAVIFQPGGRKNPYTRTKYKFKYNEAKIGWTAYGLMDINEDGILHLAIKRKKGDFYVDWSKIYAAGFRDKVPGPAPAPVPEPATMLLMGAGLAGMTALRRRKNRKK